MRQWSVSLRIVQRIRPQLSLWLLGAALAVTVGCSAGDGSASPATVVAGSSEVRSAVFAGGCFWCMEPPFDKLEGVLSTTSGYAGGNVKNPGYKQVTAGGTGHLESVEVRYDPARVSFETLLEVYWRNVDPLDAGGQFCDRGESYQTAIFTMNAQEQMAAEASKRAVAERLGQPIATAVLPLAADNFYAAEDYHQDYYRKNPVRYKFYRSRCGRDSRLEAVWGKPQA